MFSPGNRSPDLWDLPHRGDHLSPVGRRCRNNKLKWIKFVEASEFQTNISWSSHPPWAAGCFCLNPWDESDTLSTDPPLRPGLSGFWWTLVQTNPHRGRDNMFRNKNWNGGKNKQTAEDQNKALRPSSLRSADPDPVKGSEDWQRNLDQNYKCFSNLVLQVL